MDTPLDSSSDGALPIAVLGGGIAGLVVGWKLQQAGLPVRVLEADNRPGGNIRTLDEDGWRPEAGPLTVVFRRPELQQLIAELGLNEQLVFAQEEAKKRFLVHRGKVQALPGGPLSFLGSPLLSLGGKLRLLREPWIAPGNYPDESLHDFATRRLGQQVAQRFLDPFVAGVFAGRPQDLVARHAFPQLVQWEQESGSILRGALRSLKQRKAQQTTPGSSPSANQPAGGARPRGIFNFREGMETLPRALSQALGPNLLLQHSVQRLAYQADTPCWRVACNTPQGDLQELEVQAVVSTLPQPAWASLQLEPASLKAQWSSLPLLPHPPVAAVVLGFPRQHVQHPLDGFGLLAPSGEQRNFLGALFVSSIFEQRAPAGQVLFTCFVGGGRQPELYQQPDERLAALVQEELQQLLGVSGLPSYQRVLRWPQAIPQYSRAYGPLADGLDALEQTWPGLYFTGNYRGGISVPDTVGNAVLLAERLVAERSTAG